MRFDDARRLVEQTMETRRLPEGTVLLAEAAGRFLAAGAVARADHPPATCSAMDGYAVRASAGPGTFTVCGPIFAGQASSSPLPPGRSAARIFTGAPLPEGADAVVRQEVARPEGDRVALPAAVAGENVRTRGSDVAAGAAILEAGARLGPRQLGLCRAAGLESVPVRRRLRVAVISTGDEIASGLVPDSNGLAVAGLAEELGAEVRTFREGDGEEPLASRLREALAWVDAAITIGGVSVGERDLVPAALERLGARVLVHGVAMKPGKPFLLALAGERAVFGLPGSPSACLVAFEALVRPGLLRMAGAAGASRRMLQLPLAEAWPGKPGRTRFLWARLQPDGRVRPLGRDTAQVRGPGLADALVHVPEAAGDLGENALVETWLLEPAGP